MSYFKAKMHQIRFMWCERSFVVRWAVTQREIGIGNKSVPIQVAQCWFPGLAISSAKILIYFSNKICGSNFIKRYSKTVMARTYQKCRLRLKNKFIVSFVIIFATDSFPLRDYIHNLGTTSNFRRFYTIRYDTRCYFNVRWKADMIQLNLPHGNNS